MVVINTFHNPTPVVPHLIHSSPPQRDKHFSFDENLSQFLMRTFFDKTTYFVGLETEIYFNEYMRKYSTWEQELMALIFSVDGPVYNEALCDWLCCIEQTNAI